MSEPVGKTYRCSKCGKSFALPASVRERYPGWEPKLCRGCHTGGSAAKRGPGNPRAHIAPPRSGKGGKSASRELNLPLDEVLRRFTAGPTDGVFTDGACSGNPGPGGWGAVYVRENQVIDQRYGQDPDTTNNRMELAALIAGYKMLPEDAKTVIYSDSQLCVRTINEWAHGWQARGWRRKTGPVQNLDLVKEAYALSLTRPGVKVRWIKAHDGSRWNEYADSLATAYLREEI